MTDMERLVAIEEIKELKARYWLGVDTRNGELLRSVFADDAMIAVQEGGNGPDRTPEIFVKHLLSMLNGARSIHQGSAPIITFHSDIEATGIWTLEDWIWAPEQNSKLNFKILHGWGHYHDVYRRTVDGWKIKSFLLNRIKVETT